jgi:RNA polymerase sigma factor (sigma-70 family)
MADGHLSTVLRHIRQFVNARVADSPSDGELLERYASRRDDGAFAALVQRHGPVVLGVCRRVLRDAHEAEDAFQATFLVLVRKAGSLDRRGSLGGWLHGVAHRVARRARSQATRRPVCAPEPLDVPSPDGEAEPTRSVMRRELGAVLDEELQRLPEKYRAALVLCDLQGKTHDEAARELRWPRGSLAKRLAGARDRLRRRLTGHGVTLSAGALAAALAETAQAVPPALVQMTLDSATRFAAGQALPHSARAVALAKGVLQAMTLSKVKTIAAVILPLGLLVGGAAWFHEASGAPAPEAAPAFPRRMLAIRPNNYLYANPVTSGFRDEKGEFKHTVPDMMRHIAERLAIPPGQFLDLSDSVPGERLRGPLKDVVEKTVADFLASSRPQDRIIVLFAGHAVVIADKPYLVPLDGRLDDPATLISLQWVYDRLAQCKARQKVLIVDGCRFDQERGPERPSSEPMHEKLYAALRKPPAGVQVWSACSQGEFSHEFEMRGLLPGGAFLNQLHGVLGEGQITRDQRPEHPIPLAALAREVGRRTSQVVPENREARQTPFVAGLEAAGGAAPDPREPLPARLTALEYPREERDFANLATVLAILDETDIIPPAKPVPAELARLKPGALPLFSSRILANYRADDKGTPLREAVHKAITVMKKHSKSFPDQFLVPVGDEDQFRAHIVRIQKDVALALLELQEAMEELTAASAEHGAETTRRWQVNYDYVLARLMNRIAYVYEYTSALGELRRDPPPRDPAVHQGWRLVSREKMKGDRNGQILNRDAGKILQGIIANHAGTPWEVLARRELHNALGLQWQPIRFGE